MTATRLEKIVTDAVCIGPAGPTLAIDPAIARAVFDRLTLWEEGLVHRRLAIAACVLDPSDDQRALLAIFADRRPMDLAISTDDAVRP
jgi:hypothetical protein